MKVLEQEVWTGLDHLVELEMFLVFRPRQVQMFW